MIKALARLWANLTAFITADFVPLSPPAGYTPPPAAEATECRRCHSPELYRAGLCKKCDDDDSAAFTCSGMFVG